MLTKLTQEIQRLTRHTTILKLVITHEPIGIIKISELSGFPQHQVRYSLRLLEQKNLIKPSPEGAIATAKGRKFVRTLGKKIESLRKSLLHLGIS